MALSAPTCGARSSDAQARTELENNIQDIESVCRMIAPARLPLSLQMNQQFATDPQFQSYVENYLSSRRSTAGTGLMKPAVQSYVDRPLSSRRGTGGTSLMDLPVELRLMIAEYALVSAKPLTWYYSEYTPKRRAGSFKHLSQATALTRVCRQLHHETAGLVWKLNTVHFNQQHFDYVYWGTNGPDSSDMSGCFDALRLFTQSAVHAANTREIVFDLQSSIWRYHISLYNLLEKWATNVSPAILKVTYSPWGFFDTKATTEDTVERFMSLGRQILHKLHDKGFGKATRHWRVFPVLTDVGRRKLKTYMEPSKFRLALEWIEEGI